MEVGMKKERLYELDWLRTIAIVILLFFHTGMFFNTWGWHIKNNDTSTILNVIMAWLHEWRMPLLLVISGAGTYFALGFRSKGSYLKERGKRLLIPLIFGMFVIVPPQIYFEHYSEYASYVDFWPSVLQFVPYPEGSFSWHHLWFIAYLFVYSLVCLPVFLYLRSDSARGLKSRLLQVLKGKIGFTWFLLAMVGSQFLFRPFFPEQKHDLTDLGYIIHYGLYFLFGYVIFSVEGVREVLLSKRRTHLILAICTLPLFYLAWFIPYTLSVGPYDFIFHIPATATAWYFILALLGYGQTWLNRSSNLLKILNEGLYPFYILHQTVIMIVAFPMRNLEWNIWLKFNLVWVGTLIICLALYVVLIRPFNLCRILFGMKPRAKRQDVKNPVRMSVVEAHEATSL